MFSAYRVRKLTVFLWRCSIPPSSSFLCRHEQNAAFMAQAMGRITGKVGVCLVTSGPGVTNLVTGLATATSEGDPVLAIGGEVTLESRFKHTHTKH